MRIASSKRKVTALNLNFYRNLHHRSLHAQKINFGKAVKELVKTLPFMETVTLHYDVYPRTKRRLDIMNVGSVVDKYFSDVLVEQKRIPDDDLKHVTFVSFGFGGLSETEHVLVTITDTSLTTRKKPMRVLLDQDDIQIALDSYLETLGIAGATGVELSVTDDGEITAEVLMGDAEPSKPKPTKKRGGRPKGSKNKPKEEPDVSETTEDGVDVSGGTDSVGTTTEAETSTETDTPDEEAPSKNPSEVSPEESSKTDGASDKEETSVDKAPVKKGSIFDDET